MIPFGDTPLLLAAEASQQIYEFMKKEATINTAV